VQGLFISNSVLDEAIDIVTQIPAGRWGTVEIRRRVNSWPTAPVDDARSESL
jgi:hypothetical protein